MNHLKQIAARLPEYGLDAMLLNSEPGEYYAVGFHGEGNVVVTAQGCFFFTDSRYIEAANHLITGAEIAMTGRSRNYRAMVQEVVDRCRIRKLGFEEGYLSVADYNLWKEGLTAELVPAQKLVDALRAAKDDGEIALMTKAQEITDRAFSEILKFIQPGMTEQEIAAKLQYDMLRFGAEKMSFDPIVVSGPNGSLPHGIPSAKQVQQGEFITMDFGCKYGGYCSDMTRTVALGEPTGEMRKVYQTVLEAQLAGIKGRRARQEHRRRRPQGHRGRGLRGVFRPRLRPQPGHRDPRVPQREHSGGDFAACGRRGVRRAGYLPAREIRRPH